MLALLARLAVSTVCKACLSLLAFSQLVFMGFCTLQVIPGGLFALAALAFGFLYLDKPGANAVSRNVMYLPSLVTPFLR